MADRAPFVYAVHVDDDYDDEAQAKKLVSASGLSPGGDDPYSSYDIGNDRGREVWRGADPVQADPHYYKKEYIPATVMGQEVVYEIWTPK